MFNISQAPLSPARAFWSYAFSGEIQRPNPCDASQEAIKAISSGHLEDIEAFNIVLINICNSICTVIVASSTSLWRYQAGGSGVCLSGTLSHFIQTTVEMQFSHRAWKGNSPYAKTAAYVHVL
jgi:hypothetical protein